jgi:alkylation response protein AidB-like acyl-CoA dehydrogenase
MRAEQMAGALERCLEQSLQYAADRRQFGRPIAKFQAVQHNLAVLAGEVAAATTSADAAVSAIARHGIEDDRTFLAVATAKIRGGQAAGAGAGIAHQVHGAMGFTREYSLQHRTRRLWAWRDEFDPEAVWAIELGRHVAKHGGDALWATVTAA